MKKSGFSFLFSLFSFLFILFSLFIFLFSFVSCRNAFMSSILPKKETENIKEPTHSEPPVYAGGIQALVFNPIADELSWESSGSPVPASITIFREDTLTINLVNPEKYREVRWFINPSNTDDFTNDDSSFTFTLSGSSDYGETQTYTLALMVIDDSGVPYNRTIKFMVITNNQELNS